MSLPKTFLFTSAQRVGSTAILNSFPDTLFYVGGPYRKELGRSYLYTHLDDFELRLAQRYDDPASFIEDVLIGYPRDIQKDIVFKVEYRTFFGNYEQWRRALFSDLSARPDIGVIHCYRANLLERFISMVRMRKSGEVGVKLDDPRVELAPFRVKPKQAVENFRRIIEQTNKVHTAFKNSPYHLIRYEDLRDDWSGCLRQLGQFTGVDLSTAVPRHQKVITDHRQVLENYDEVRRAVIDEFGKQTVLNFQPSG